MTAGLILITKLLEATRVIKKENAGIAVVLFVVGGIATWLMWLMVFLHQWRPLLTPTYP